MFEITNGEYKLMFEYETVEELRELRSIADSLLQKMEIVDCQTEDKAYRGCTFFDLEPIFILHKKKMGKVGKSSLKMYQSTFNDLKLFFKDINLKDLKYKDVEDFQNYLLDKGLNTKTINNKMTYLKMFFEHAQKHELIRENVAKNIEMLKEVKKIKENFTDKEVLLLLDNNIERSHYDFFMVAAFTGMRLQEILSITHEDIKFDTKENVRYIDIPKSKTANGYRKIPIHPAINDIQFPVFFMPERYNGDIEAFSTYIGKILNDYIHTNIEDQDKSIHTFRGTFVQKLMNKFPDRMPIILEITGHSQGAQSLTINTYGKEFYLNQKFDIIRELNYSQD